jgi:CHAT domain
MIEASLETKELVVDHPGAITVQLTNAGRGTCTNIVFKLKLPVQVVLLQGADRIEIDRLDAGQSVTRSVRVRPKRAGTWSVTSENFAYRDMFGRARRITDFRLDIQILASVPITLVPEPEFAVALHTNELPLGEWGTLAGRVVNSGRSALQRVSVRAVGPVTHNPLEPWQALGPVSPGSRAEFAILVRADGAGKKVPVYVEVAYTDVAGRSGRQLHMTPVHVRTLPAKSSGGPSGELPGRVRVLFLAADPTDAARLRLGQEFREIQERLQLAQMRDRFELNERWAVRPADISQALLDKRPQIVYFSGHGSRDGALCFEDELGRTQPVRPNALAALFALVTDHVDCVVLNACYSEAHADAIATHVRYVIGMSKAIGDKAAIAFSVGFYQAIGANRSIEDAYKFGCAQIQLQDLPEHLTPVLRKRK